MGWWNDAVLPAPEAQQRFEAVTADLYASIVTAVMAVVNA